MARFHWTIENVLKNLLRVFLVLLPWQTIVMTRESFLNGVKWEYGTLGFYGSEILLWITFFVFIGWIFQKSKSRKVKGKSFFTTDRIFLFFTLLFVLWGFASIIWAPDKDLALQHALHIMEAVILFLIVLVGPLSFRQSGYWFVLGAVPVAILAIPQFIFQTTWASKWLGLSSHVSWLPGASIVSSDSIGRLLRSYGSFSHPNVFGGYMAMVFVWLIALFSIRVFGKKYKYLFQYILSTFIILGLFLSFSRSALCASMFLLFVMILYSIYNRKGFFRSSSFWYIILLFVSLGMIFSPILETRFSVSSRSEVTSFVERTSSAAESWNMFQNNTWTGVGAGNYTLALYQKDSSRPGWEYQPVHNVGLLVGAEMGLVGLGLLSLSVLSCLVFLSSSVEKTKKKKDWLIDNMSFVFVVVMFSFFYLILAFFDHYLFSSYVGLMMTGVYWGLSCRFILADVHR
ncbi:hypothetical protein C0581_04405 [Candidatus Parcubacteria bacterium]|nr:MAG: hypothetical protein C0581_04405 [Candidatus Parcubacteria bacterium]